jgi:hypothetical protein
MSITRIFTFILQNFMAAVEFPACLFEADMDWFREGAHRPAGELPDAD